MRFGDWEAALKARDVIRELINEQIDKQRPNYSYAVVQNISPTEQKATVQFPGSDPIDVRMGVVQPVEIGQIVKVGGRSNDKSIQEVYGPSNIPLGEIGYTEITNDQTIVPPLDVVIGLSKTIDNIRLGRLLKITVDVTVNSSVVGDTFEVRIKEIKAHSGGTGSDRTAQSVSKVSGTDPIHVPLSYRVNTEDYDLWTWQIRIVRISGTGNMQVFASGTSPGFLLVEDLGVLIS